jgi:hypothetical protein
MEIEQSAETSHGPISLLMYDVAAAFPSTTRGRVIDMIETNGVNSRHSKMDTPVALRQIHRILD